MFENLKFEISDARLALTAILASVFLGCAPFGPRLTFSERAIRHHGNETWYDPGGSGRWNFGMRAGADGRIKSLLYDDDSDGKPDRAYRLADYADEDVPHLILMLDSIPYDAVRQRYERGDFRWFGEPVKVVPVFPTLTELCYTKVLGAAPLVGMTDQYFDVEKNQVHGGFWRRTRGWRQPWEYQLDYHADYFEAALTYVRPRDWLGIEMGRIREALNRDKDHVTVGYTVTASGMVSKYGRRGLQETLDAARRLCLQVLYERRGAVKISMMADHASGLVESKSASKALITALADRGFRVGERMKIANDVVIELSALVNYVGIRTRRAAEVANAVTTAKEVELAMHLEGSSVIVRDARGTAAIEHRDGAYRYRVIDRDVLGYAPVMDELRKAGKLSSDGWASDRDWFVATADHRYPDAPKRVWEAFHGLVISPPDVMVTLKPGWYAGERELERWITMKSTHGSLDRDNSVTFLMTMKRNATTQPLRGEEIMAAIEPGWNLKFQIRNPKSQTSSDEATEKRGAN